MSSRKTLGAAFAVAAVLISVLVTAPAHATDPRAIRVNFATIARGLDSPVAIAAPGDGTGRIFIVEQPGRIRVFVPHTGLLSTPFLDIRSRVACCGERGLLGLAFHPSFKTNGTLFVAYTRAGTGAVRVARYHASAGSNRASTTETFIIEQAHGTYANHNGGQLAFGPDGFLYLGIGDGGSGGDPNGNAQKLSTLLGKIIRIDVNRSCSGRRYCIPSTNPLANSASSSVRKEIFLWGLRNPWRFSFDRYNGQLWVADVGQNAREEVDLLGKGVGGKNLGWDCREGSLNTVATYGGAYCTGKTFTGPRLQYSHSGGRCAIIGGYVYRGNAYASLMGGMYFYADYCTGEVWGYAKTSSGSWVSAIVRDHGSNILTFGETYSPRELYAADAGGGVYHLVPVRR